MSWPRDVEFLIKNYLMPSAESVAAAKKAVLCHLRALPICEGCGRVLIDHDCIRAMFCSDSCNYLFCSEDEDEDMDAP